MSNTIPTSPLEIRDHRKSSAELRALIQMRERNDDLWQEVVPVPIIARNSAGFCASEPCVVGRLISLALPMPVELRAYDKETEIYTVVGIVENCYKSTVEGTTRYQVRVGFIGKEAPESYKRDPRQSYRITGMNDDGFWRITEAEVQFKTRTATRFSVSTPVTVSMLRNGKPTIGKEVCISRNVSASGVSLPCNLCVKEGDKVKVAFTLYGFYALAIVRSRKVVRGKVPILHLEFVDDKFPLNKIRGA